MRPASDQVKCVISCLISKSVSPEASVSELVVTKSRKRKSDEKPRKVKATTLKSTLSLNQSEISNQETSNPGTTEGRH